MKRSLFAALALATLFLATAAHARQQVYGELLFDEPAVAYSKTSTVMTTDGIEDLSLQAVWSSATIAAVTFYDGRKSTATITVSSNTALTGARVVINNVALTEGTDWTKGSTSTATAKSISDAIMANSSLSAIIASTWTAAGVVTATATTVGVNAYTLYTSTNAGLRLNGSASNSSDTFLNGLASSIDLTTEVITVASPHNLTTGLPVLYATGTFTTPTGLVNGTTYYAIRDTTQTYPDVSFKLASSAANAIAGTAINITAVNGSGTFTLTPLAFAGTPSFKIQVSNDSSNWFDLNVSSVTYSAASNTYWDLGDPAFRYLRVNYTAGTAGGLNLRVRANGRK